MNLIDIYGNANEITNENLSQCIDSASIYLFQYWIKEKFNNSRIQKGPLMSSAVTQWIQRRKGHEYHYTMIVRQLYEFLKYQVDVDL